MALLKANLDISRRIDNLNARIEFYVANAEGLREDLERTKAEIKNLSELRDELVIALERLDDN